MAHINPEASEPDEQTLDSPTPLESLMNTHLIVGCLACKDAAWQQINDGPRRTRISVWMRPVSDLVVSFSPKRQTIVYGATCPEGHYTEEIVLTPQFRAKVQEILGLPTQGDAEIPTFTVLEGGQALAESISGVPGAEDTDVA